MVTTAQHYSMQVYAEKVRLDKLGLERVSSSKNLEEERTHFC